MLLPGACLLFEFGGVGRIGEGTFMRTASDDEDDPCNPVVCGFVFWISGESN